VAGRLKFEDAGPGTVRKPDCLVMKYKVLERHATRDYSGLDRKDTKAY
jgi:hypothetical protein